jgi:polyisoprenyl-phosphate glycosyltransferase
MGKAINSPAKGYEECIAILIPVFNDWDSLARLLLEIDSSLQSSNLRATVTVVDDGSTVELPDSLRHSNYQRLESVEVVRLLCNMGHQRAIAVGLVHLNKIDLDANCIVVMDGDGQDRAQDIPRLVAELNSTQAEVVFAARSKRSEEFAFRVLYYAYRLLYHLLTGHSIYWGNFSVVSRSALAAIIARPDTWNHYAASIVRSRIPFSTVALPRGNRYVGESHMRYSSLVIHGLSGISTFREIVGLRLMVAFSVILALLFGLLCAGGFGWYLTGGVLFSWMAMAACSGMIFSALGLLISLLFVLSVLGRRSESEVIPSNTAYDFVATVTKI